MKRNRITSLNYEVNVEKRGFVPGEFLYDTNAEAVFRAEAGAGVVTGAVE